MWKIGLYTWCNYLNKQFITFFGSWSKFVWSSVSPWAPQYLGNPTYYCIQHCVSSITIQYRFSQIFYSNCCPHWLLPSTQHRLSLLLHTLGHSLYSTSTAQSLGGLCYLNWNIRQPQKRPCSLVMKDLQGVIDLYILYLPPCSGTYLAAQTGLVI
jgi:hypothetical protein